MFVIQRWARLLGGAAVVVVLVAIMSIVVLVGEFPAPVVGSVAAAPIAADLDGTRLTLASGANEARYRVREQLMGRSLPNEAVGRSTEVSGGILLDPAGVVLSDYSKVVIDLRTLKSDDNRRDNYIQRNTLTTSQYPTAELVILDAPGLLNPLPPTGEATFQLVGNLTVRGVTRATTWQTTAQFTDQAVVGSAWTEILLTDFGIQPPRAGPVLSIEDNVILEIDFSALRDANSRAESVRPLLAKQAVESYALAAPRSAVGPARQTASCTPTRPDQLGPFYVPGAPLRNTVGTGYVLSGAVRTADGCVPIPEALVELWMANPEGRYEDAYRAAIVAGPEGEYRFESHAPPPYAGRPPHIHLRVSAPGYRTLVTQHYPQSGAVEAVFDLVLIPA